MKKHLIVIFAIIFSCNLLAVDKEYIPESSVLVVSSKIDNVSQKAGVSTKELINDIIFSKLSTNFSEQRKDERVSYSFQNEVVNLLNFNKNSKAILLDTLDAAVITDVANLEAIDLLMIRIALEERIDILSGDGLNFRYLELDDYIAFAWNKDVFTVISVLNSKLNSNYFNFPLSGEKEPMGLLETAKLIFSKKAYNKDKHLLDMHNKNNDILIWLDSYYFCKLGITAVSIYGDGLNEIVSWYKGSSVVVETDFSDAKVNSIINSYYPAMPIDETKLKKEMNNVVLKYVNDNAMLGFLSLAFNPIELGKLLDLTVKQLETPEIAKQLEYVQSMLNNAGIKNYEELMTLFGGDVFAYAFGDTNNEYTMNYLISVSVKDEAKVMSLIEMALKEKAQEADAGYYISLGAINIYIKSGILYIGNNVAIESVLNNKLSTTALSKYKTDMMKNKTFAVYLDLKTLLKSPYFSETSLMIFEDMYLTTEYVSKTESKSIIEVNFVDKGKNALEIIYNALK